MAAADPMHVHPGTRARDTPPNAGTRAQARAGFLDSTAQRSDHDGEKRVLPTSSLPPDPNTVAGATEAALQRFRKASALIGRREACRLLQRLPGGCGGGGEGWVGWVGGGVPPALAGIVSSLSQQLVRAACVDATMTTTIPWGGHLSKDQGGEGSFKQRSTNSYTTELDESAVRERFSVSDDARVLLVNLPLDPSTGWGNLGESLSNTIMGKSLSNTITGPIHTITGES